MKAFVAPTVPRANLTVVLYPLFAREVVPGVPIVKVEPLGFVGAVLQGVTTLRETYGLAEYQPTTDKCQFSIKVLRVKSAVGSSIR